MIIDGAIQRQVYWKIGFPPGTTGMVVIGIVALRDCKMTGSRPVVLAGIVLSTIPALLPLPFRSGIPGRGVPAGGIERLMKILFADVFPPPRLERLRGEGHECRYAPALTGDDLPGAVPGFEALVVRSTRIGAAALEAGDSLKLVVRAGAGTNTIDTGRARELRIDVCNVPGANALAVAELTLGLIISADRWIPDNVADLRNGAWNKKRYSRARGLFGAFARGGGGRGDRARGRRTRGGVRDADPGAREPAARRRRPRAPRRTPGDGAAVTRGACREERLPHPARARWSADRGDSSIATSWRACVRARSSSTPRARTSSTSRR